MNLNVNFVSFPDTTPNRTYIIVPALPLCQRVRENCKHDDVISQDGCYYCREMKKKTRDSLFVNAFPMRQKTWNILFKLHVNGNTCNKIHF